MTKIKRSGALVTAFACVGVLGACGANEGILNSGRESAPVNTASPRNPLDKELDAMRTAGFELIYVVKRKDGGKLEADDRGFIKLQTNGANRRVATDDGLAVVIGSNTQIAPNNMAALSQRFTIDDYSPPAETNGNSNANK